MNSKIEDALRTVLDALGSEHITKEEWEAKETLETYLNTFSN